MLRCSCCAAHDAHYILSSSISVEIPFESEAELRSRGTSRTPDVLLSCPLGVQVHADDDPSSENTEWKVICWIDSKVGRQTRLKNVFSRLSILLTSLHTTHLFVY
jgi:hypothetical protein